MSDTSPHFPSFSGDSYTSAASLPGDELSPAERGLVAQRLQAIDALSPAEIERLILAHGYRGQDHARR
ncbi:MAG: hypothetical protein KDL87_19100, partial [Verrucomicrobiae bacterium]|nr:hypothetical protein [Verrucomicrobiae bacterium]